MGSTTISTDQPVVTLINTFTVAPERREELIRLLVEATESVMRHRPGFVSANIHRGLDPRHVANYAQWRSVEHFQAMLTDPVAVEHMRRASEIAEADPRLYTVAEVVVADPRLRAAGQ